MSDFTPSILQTIHNALPQTTPQFLILLGTSGSGKTHLANELEGRYENKAIASRHFAHSKSQRRAMFLHGLEPESYNLPAMRSTVQAILEQRPVSVAFKHRLNHHVEEQLKYLATSQHPTIILEGTPWLNTLDLIPEPQRLVVTLLHRNLEDWYARTRKRDATERGHDANHIKSSILRRCLYFMGIREQLAQISGIALSTTQHNTCTPMDLADIPRRISGYYDDLIARLNFKDVL